MSNKFILKEISSRIVIINQDSKKREWYGANHDINNDKKILQHTLGITKIKDSGLLSDCIYININKVRQNLYIKPILAINNF